LVSKPLLYLDACAATPPDLQVLEQMQQHQGRFWANPSSVHPAGIAAAELLERSRQRLLERFGWPHGQVVFTSGGTEADNLAVLGVGRSMKPGRLLISPLEHPAVSAAAAQLQQDGWALEVLPLNDQGQIDLDALEPLLEPPTQLVSIAWASSELGTLQPMDAIAERCAAAGIPLHSDAVQVIGQLPLAGLKPIGPDLISLSAHKFQGPRGIGALVMQRPLRLQPQLLGGGQESGLRSGTESPWLAAALVHALERRESQQPQLVTRLRRLRDDLLQDLLKRCGIRLSGSSDLDQRLPHHISLLLNDSAGEPVSGRAIVRALAAHGVAISSGSACSSGRDRPSPSLLATGVPKDEASSGIRISLGPWIEDNQLVDLPDLLESQLRIPTAPAP
jgi:cysteine desulfurase